MALLLTLAEAKTHLRISENNEAEDSDIQRRIKSATEFIENIIETPIQQITEVAEVARPNHERALIVVPVRKGKAGTVAVTAVKYWTADADPGAAPDETVTPGRLAYTGIGSGEYYGRLWPPKDGWPTGHPDTCFQITIAAEVLPEDIPSAWKDAALLVLDELYGQRGDMPTGIGYQRAAALVENWRPWRG